MSAHLINLPYYGATVEEWNHFDLILGLTADLLPVVSNPNAEISPDSKMKALGKTPSRYNSRRQVAGITSWTSYVATSADISQWVRQRDLGICLQTRTVRAIDVDIPDAQQALDVQNVLFSFCREFPCRLRSDSAKFLLVFQLPGDLPKRVIKTQHGIIELLGTGQQFIACGTHTGGQRYEWDGGLPNEIPSLTLLQVNELWSMLQEQFGIEPSTEAKTSTRKEILHDAQLSDPTAVHLVSRGMVLSRERDGRLHINCPFSEEHTTASAESATTYWPAHTGGYERGHFKCLHAHCAQRTDRDFLDALGISEDDFDVVNESEPVVGQLERFHVQPVAEFASGAPTKWIVKNVLPQADLAVVYGETGSGKTFFMIDLVCSIALGQPWRDKKVKQSRVVYIVAEGSGGFRNRLKAYAEHHGVDLNDLDIGVIGDAPNFMMISDMKALIASIRLYGDVDLIIVDTLAQSMPGGNENSGEDVGKVLSHCKALNKALGALVVLVHHSGKDATRGARGWSGLKAAADAEIEVNRCDEQRSVKTSKLKDGKDGIEYGFKLNTIVLGKDEDGDDITSCVLEHTDYSPIVTKKEAVKGSKAQLIMRLATEMLELGGTLSVTVLIDAVIQQTPLDAGKKDTRRAVIMKALDGLVNNGLLRVDGTQIILGE